MISYEDFLKKYNYSEDSFRAADISWGDLCDIYADFSMKIDDYSEKLKNFMDKYFDEKTIREKGLKIHSIGARIKNPEHLIDKIVRKKKENYKKYEKCDKYNYQRFLTDLAGIRILMVYRTDWENIHRYIEENFENDEKNYVKDYIDGFDDDEEHTYIAEKPKVYIRRGDNVEIYHNIAPNYLDDTKPYRSIHYIIKYSGIYIEIQVRTLFEEGWGEVDHSILYPSYKNDAMYNEYTKLLNRVSGLADEMALFFQSLEREKNKSKNEKQQINIKNEEKYDNMSETKENGEIPIVTYKDMVNSKI